MMRVFILVLVYFGFCQGITADENDEYIKRLNKQKSIVDPIERDTQLIWHYNYVSENLSRYMDPRAEAYLDTLFELANKTNWKSGIPFYHRAKGRYHDFRGEPAEALVHYTDAIEGFKLAKGNLKELAFSYVLKGFLLSNSDMHYKCMEVFEEGLPYARAAVGKNSLCLMLDWFGDLYFYGLDSSGVADNEKALDYYMQVNKILPQISYQRIIASNHTGLSGVYGRLGQQELSDYHYAIADSITVGTNLTTMRWGLLAEKARQLEKKGLHQEANKIYMQCKEFLDPTTNIEFKSRLEKELWINYKNLGNHKKSLFHYERHVEMENKMATNEVEMKYAELQAKYDVVVKQQEIDELNKKNQRHLGYFLIGLLGVLSLFALMLSQKNKLLNKRATELEEKQKEVNKALIKGEKVERKRLAGELHDNVNTKLAAIRWRLEAVSDEVSDKAKDIFDDTIMMMNDVYSDVRHISHNLVPSKLEEIGLLAAITNQIHTLNSGGNTQFQLTHSSVAEEFLADMKYPLYNIIFELMNNIVKHSEAENADILLCVKDNHLEITIKDDGKGFAPEGRKDGIGFQNVKSRVQSLSGELAINSIVGKGTSINIQVPLKWGVLNV